MQPILGTIGVLAALGIGGTTYAVTSGTTTPAPAGAVQSAALQASGPGGAAAGLRIRALLRHTDHASVEVKRNGQWVTYDVDRGMVTAVSPTSITLQRPDGQNITFTIGSSTRYRGVESESQLQLRKPALVISTNGAALRIRQADGASGGAAPSGTAPSGAAPSVSGGGGDWGSPT